MEFGSRLQFESREKVHDRLESRRSSVREDSSGPEWDGKAGLYGRQQSIRIERERKVARKSPERSLPSAPTNPIRSSSRP